MDRDERIQCFDLHQEGVRFLLEAEAAKTKSGLQILQDLVVEIAYA